MAVMGIERHTVGRVNIILRRDRMPYKTRKMRNKDLYWVIDEDGKHYSKEGLRKDVAERQIIALNIAHAKKQNELVRKFIAKI